MTTPLHEVSIVDQTVSPPIHAEIDGSPTWLVRGSNFVVAVTQARRGTCLAIDANADEYMIYLPDCGARVSAEGYVLEVAADSVVVAPPGSSQVEATGEGWILRCFSSRRVDLLRRAANAADFALPRPDVAPLKDWPAPTGGYRLRAYHVPECRVAGQMTTVFQCSTMMISLYTSTEPRDIRALTPHAHADFEQASIGLAGAWVHHIRYPWTADMTTWRTDETLTVGSPSVTVIPPPVIHTTRNIGRGRAILVDLFVPPRSDFAKRPGSVRNFQDYPFT